jgi:hypothetical protein
MPRLTGCSRTQPEERSPKKEQRRKKKDTVGFALPSFFFLLFSSDRWFFSNLLNEARPQATTARPYFFATAART